MVPRCLLQPALVMRPSRPSTKKRSDEFQKYAVMTRIMEERRKSIKSADRKKKCVEKVEKDMCLRRGMKQTLGSMVEARKQADRQWLVSLLGYDLLARLTRAANDIEL